MLKGVTLVRTLNRPMRVPTYTMYNTLRNITWHQVMNKISLPWYIPGSTHTALGLRISISIYLHNSLK